MNVLFFLIPISFCLGLIGLGAFVWNLRNGQYEDLSGAAERVLIDAPAATDRGLSHRPEGDAPLPRPDEKAVAWSRI